MRRYLSSHSNSRMAAFCRPHAHRTVNPNTNVKLVLSRTFSSSNNTGGGGSWRQQQQQFSSLSPFWVSALGSCAALQLYETHRHYSQTTWMEKGPTDSDNEDNSKDTTEKEEETKKAPWPWYRRYPSATLERLRSMKMAPERPPSKPYLDNRTLFYGQCLQRQLYQPQVPYPAWDYNWDGKVADYSSLEALSTAQGLVASGKTGTTRHILLIRHGQYEEEPFDDQKRCLTALGKRQAQLTGRRMATLVKQINAINNSSNNKRGKARINAIHTSDLLRAKQTAWILAQGLPPTTTDGTTETDIPISNPDPDLNEGLPAPMIPPRPDLPGVMEEVDEQQERMERAFHRYFYRADPSPELVPALKQQRADRTTGGTQLQRKPSADYNFSASGTVLPTMHSPSSGAITPNPSFTPFPTNVELPPPDHEFDIIVCHGNIIRYFLCRALQLPPEAWLRLSVFNCSVSYIMIKPNGYVSCRMIGDIGHLGYKETTFSGAHGLLWS